MNYNQSNHFSFINQQASTYCRKMHSWNVWLLYMYKRGSVLRGMNIWDAAVVHLDCAFPCHPQGPGHKNVLFPFLCIYPAADSKMHENPLHVLLLLCFQRARFHGLLQRQDTHAPITAHMLSLAGVHVMSACV